MARIKVTGYINTEDMDYDDVDLGHSMGITDDAYTAFVIGMKELPTLDEMEFEKVED